MDEDEIHEQENHININDKTWRDGNGMGVNTYSNPDPPIKNNLIDKHVNPFISSEDQEMLKQWSQHPEFQENLDSNYNILTEESDNAGMGPLKKNEKRKKDNNPSGMGGNINEEEEAPNKNNLIDKHQSSYWTKEEEDKINEWRKTPEFQKGYDAMLKEMIKENRIPTRKELNERFASSFKPFIARFKEDIKHELTSLEPNIPLRLDTLWGILTEKVSSSSFSLSQLLKDDLPNEEKQVPLELAKVDLKIIDPNNPNLGDPKGSHEDIFECLSTSSIRDYHNRGSVTNPGIGDEWINITYYDEGNDRTLDIKFKLHLQVPLSW